MAGKRVRTGATLTVLAIMLAGMAVYGWKAASAPFPSFGDDTKKQTCTQVRAKRQISRKEITVSVFNGSNRSGLADRTMAALEKRSFRAGDVSNAPDSAKVSRVEVWSTIKGDPAADLVARQFKPVAKVVLSEDALGPGVDILLGPKYRKLRTPAPKVLRLAEPKKTCVSTR